MIGRLTETFSAEVGFCSGCVGWAADQYCCRSYCCTQPCLWLNPLQRLRLPLHMLLLLLLRSGKRFHLRS
jgi:hypothetical protein